MKKIGVLDIQGSVIEHMRILECMDEVVTKRVKQPGDLKEIDGLILPGGESTTMGKLIKAYKLDESMRQVIQQGLPVWGTCAGMILLAKEIVNQNTNYLGLMDIVVKRNAYGRQIDSFITETTIQKVSPVAIPLVFIRAPLIISHSNQVETLSEINGSIVAAKQENMMVTSFHPELTSDLSFHKYFISTC
jgi:5'-phosphate synthase pdxT subunit